MLAEASRGQHWSVHLSNKSDVDQDTARYIIIRCRRAFLLSQLEDTSFPGWLLQEDHPSLENLHSHHQNLDELHRVRMHVYHVYSLGSCRSAPPIDRHNLAEPWREC
jgi:hypothetical protein